MLVGGFAANPWLYSELDKQLTNFHTSVFRAQDATAKAAAHGAVSFYLDHFVSARVARWTYGIPCGHAYDASNPKHFARRQKVYQDAFNGREYVSGGFAIHLVKGTVVNEKDTKRISLNKTMGERRSHAVRIELLCYQGDSRDVEFFDEEDDEG
ncbi:hypothetical protein FRC03_011054 [Tulasnella sp. 419]|nr:hypothetical protein FRC03_011054 [Tulasnella sp. 419]